MILHFRGECERNLEQGREARERLPTFELPDLVQCAYHLLSGPEADGSVLSRPDLGE